MKNGAGFYYNNRFGFGLMNANSFVNVASNWENVGEQISIKIPSFDTPLFMDSKTPVVSLDFFYDDKAIKYIEHVVVSISIDYTLRGALEISIISPQSTETELLSKRFNDKSNRGFKNWKLTSVATWGENPSGLWQIIIVDKV